MDPLIAAMNIPTQSSSPSCTSRHPRSGKLQKGGKYVYSLLLFFVCLCCLHIRLGGRLLACLHEIVPHIDGLHARPHFDDVVAHVDGLPTHLHVDVCDDGRLACPRLVVVVVIFILILLVVSYSSCARLGGCPPHPHLDVVARIDGLLAYPHLVVSVAHVDGSWVQVPRNFGSQIPLV